LAARRRLGRFDGNAAASAIRRARELGVNFFDTAQARQILTITLPPWLIPGSRDASMGASGDDTTLHERDSGSARDRLAGVPMTATPAVRRE